MISDSQPKISLYDYLKKGQNRDTQTVACTLYRFYLKRHQNAFGGRAPPGLEKRGTSLNFEPPIAKLYVIEYPLVTRDSVFIIIIILFCQREARQQQVTDAVVAGQQGSELH